MTAKAVVATSYSVTFDRIYKNLYKKYVYKCSFTGNFCYRSLTLTIGSKHFLMKSCTVQYAVYTFLVPFCGHVIIMYSGRQSPEIP